MASEEKKRKKAKSEPAMPTAQEVCEQQGLTDVDLEYTELDYQKLTNFHLFQQTIRPRIQAENVGAKSWKLVMLVAAKWREFAKSRRSLDQDEFELELNRNFPKIKFRKRTGSPEKNSNSAGSSLFQERDSLTNSTFIPDLYIPYEEKKDAGLEAKLQEDLSWYDVPGPIFIQRRTHPETNSSILKIQMNSKEVAIAAYLGLKLKYPGLKIDKTGALVDLKPDENGHYTLEFKDRKGKRYLGTLAKFAPFCSRPEAAPIISRGCSDDLVYVSYQHKDDALRALWGVAEDEDFPELQVAPDCRN